MSEAGYPQRKHSPGTDETPDGELVALAKRGDRHAFGRLLRRHQRRVFALGVRWLRSADDADDLVQETFVRAWKGLATFDGSRAFVPWLMAIAANRARTAIARRRPTEAPDEGIVWEGPSPLEDAERALRARDVARAAATLPEEQRVVLHLRAVEELSYREIAEAMDVPVGTVMSRLARARRALRGALGEGWAEERDPGAGTGA